MTSCQLITYIPEMQDGRRLQLQSQSLLPWLALPSLFSHLQKNIYILKTCQTAVIWLALPSLFSHLQKNIYVLKTFQTAVICHRRGDQLWFSCSSDCGLKYNLWSKLVSGGQHHFRKVPLKNKVNMFWGLQEISFHGETKFCYYIIISAMSVFLMSKWKTQMRRARACKSFSHFLPLGTIFC